jgi:hypothetical protein
MESTQGKNGFGEWLRWYVGTILLGVVLAFGANFLFGLHPMRGIVGYCALLFLTAAMDRPPALFRMVRNTRWFAHIRSDRAMRWLLTFFAVAGLAAALFLPNESSR